MAKHGGKRKGAGRKPKADEIAMLEKMDATLAPDKVWKALADKVQDKDTQAIKCWLAYRYGQPKETVQVNADVNRVDLSNLTDEQLEQLDSILSAGKG